MNLRKLIGYSPEFILIAITVFYIAQTYWYNPFGLGLLGLIILQLIIQNKIFGLIMGTIFTLLTLYMFLALASELSEFTSWTQETTHMIVVGTLLLGTCLLAGIWLVKKNVIRAKVVEESVD